jgi:hypothetical protein
LIDSFVLSPDTHKTKVNESFIKVPSIVVDWRWLDPANPNKWAEVNVWNIYRVFLWLKPSFLSLEFEWKVKSIEVIVNWWRYDPVIEIISEDRKIKWIGKLMERINIDINNLATD